MVSYIIFPECWMCAYVSMHIVQHSSPGLVLLPSSRISVKVYVSLWQTHITKIKIKVVFSGWQYWCCPWSVFTVYTLSCFLCWVFHYSGYYIWYLRYIFYFLIQEILNPHYPSCLYIHTYICVHVSMFNNSKTNVFNVMKIFI